LDVAEGPKATPLTLFTYFRYPTLCCAAARPANQFICRAGFKDTVVARQGEIALLTRRRKLQAASVLFDQQKHS
jgi:hypothetical protein